jgi:Fibronectin type III domain/Pentapeptide repeats (8 copies)
MATSGAFGGLAMSAPARGPMAPRGTNGRRRWSVIRWGVGPLAVSLLVLAFAAPATAKTPKLKKPGQPLSLTAVPANDGATFSWSAPVSNGGSPITGYTLTIHDATCSTSGATSCAISSLVNGHNYTARVRATNAIGTGRASRSVKFVAGQSPNCSNFTPGANLRYCHLGNQNLDGYDLSGADLSGAILRDTTFNGTNLDNAIFNEATGEAKLDSAGFGGAQMVGAQFADMYLEDDDFGGANLTNASFDGAVIVTTGFYGATMTGADMNASWYSDGCPDGTNSDDDGDTCANNIGSP